MSRRPLVVAAGRLHWRKWNPWPGRGLTKLHWVRHLGIRRNSPRARLGVRGLVRVAHAGRDDALIAWLAALTDAGRGRSDADFERIADCFGGARGTHVAERENAADNGYLNGVDAVFELVGSELGG